MNIERWTTKAIKGCKALHPEKEWISVDDLNLLIEKIGFKAKYDLHHRGHIIDTKFNKGVLSTIQEIETKIIS